MKNHIRRVDLPSEACCLILIFAAFSAASGSKSFAGIVNDPLEPPRAAVEKGGQLFLENLFAPANSDATRNADRDYLDAFDPCGTMARSPSGNNAVQFPLVNRLGSYACLHPIKVEWLSICDTLILPTPIPNELLKVPIEAA